MHLALDLLEDFEPKDHDLMMDIAIYNNAIGNHDKALEIYENGSRVATLEYVNDQISLINGDGLLETLNSLQDLANSIANDPAFATNVALRTDSVDLSINYLRYTLTQTTYDNGTATTTIGNNLVFGTNSSNVIFVKGQSTFNDNVYVRGDVSFNGRFFVVDDVSFGGKLRLVNDASFNSRLFVGGDVSFGSKLFVSDDLSLNGNLSVGKNIVSSGTVAIDGDVTLKSKLYLTSDASLNSSLVGIGG